jgi:pSer/pThr/pTyr-binding forkhead associated (FHA) protein
MDKLKLKVTAGNAAGTEIHVGDALLIGRSSDGEGRLGEDIEISRRHARIARSPEGVYEIEDLGSTNGTLVNGRLIDTPEELFPGDTIEVGATTLVVQVTAFTTAVEEEAPAPEPELELELEPEPAFEPEPEPHPETPAADPVASVPGPAAVEEEPAAAPLPRLSLRLEIDFEAGEAEIALDDESEPIRLVLEDGRWRAT